MKRLNEYIDELRSLDQHNIGSWPTWAHALAIAVVALTIIAICTWYFVMPRQSQLAKAQQEETTLKQEFRAKQSQVANLGAYQKQLAAMKTQFSKLLNQLPTRSEVPSLLNGISQTRSDAGLDEKLFKPEPQKKHDFYAVLPNDLKVTGTFDQLGRFISGVAALPRIVTINDIQITPVRETTNKLSMSMTAKTYRYLGNKTRSAKP